METLQRSFDWARCNVPDFDPRHYTDFSSYNKRLLNFFSINNQLPKTEIQFLIKVLKVNIVTKYHCEKKNTTLKFKRMVDNIFFSNNEEINQSS